MIESEAKLRVLQAALDAQELVELAFAAKASTSLEELEDSILHLLRETNRLKAKITPEIREALHAPDFRPMARDFKVRDRGCAAMRLAIDEEAREVRAARCDTVKCDTWFVIDDPSLGKSSGAGFTRDWPDWTPDRGDSKS